MKVCRTCNIAKLDEDFYPNYTSGGRKRQCKSCHNFQRRYNLISNMVSNAKQRAKRNNLEFDIDQEFIIELKSKQGNLCALSGWELDWDHTSSGKRICPFNRASLDRIDSQKGYTKDNVQLLADMVNRVKNSYDQDLFLEMCLQIASNHEKSKNS